MNDATEDHQPTVEPQTTAISNPDPSEKDRIAHQAVGVIDTAPACKPAAAGSTANDSGMNAARAAESTDGGVKGTAAGGRASGTDCASTADYLGTGDDAGAIADVFGSDSVAAAINSNATHENSSVADGPRAAGQASASTTDRVASSAGAPASRTTQHHIPSVAGGEKPAATTASIELLSAVNTPETSPLVEGALADEARGKAIWRGREGTSKGSKGLGNMSLKEPLMGGQEACEEPITMVGTDDHTPGTIPATGSHPTSAATQPVTLYYGVGVAGEILQPLDTQLPGDSVITSGGKETSSPGDAAQSIALAGAKEGWHPEEADPELSQGQEESNEPRSTSECAATEQLEPVGPSGRQSQSDMEAGADASGVVSLDGYMAETSSAGAKQAQSPDRAGAQLECELRQERFVDDAEGGARHAEALAPSVTDMAGDLNSLDGSTGKGSLPREGRNEEEEEAEPEALSDAEPKATGKPRTEGKPAGKAGTEPSSDSVPAEDAAEGSPMALMEIGAPAAAPRMAAAESAPADPPSLSSHAAVKSVPTSSPTVTASRRAGTLQATAALSNGASSQAFRGSRAMSKPGSSASAQSTGGRMAAVTTTSGPQAAALPVASSDAGISAPIRGASVDVTRPGGTSRTSKVARSYLPADANSLPHNAHEHAKAKSYAQLYTGRSIDVPSGSGTGVQSSAAAEEPGQSSSQLFCAIEPGAKSVDSEDGHETSPVAGSVSPNRDGGGRLSKVDGSGAPAPHRHMPWADPNDELGLIVQVEAEAVQLGLEIYARADNSPGDYGGSGRDVGHKGRQVGEGESGEEETLEAIMAMGRRPSEIAELLLGGRTAEVSASKAGNGDVEDGKEARRHHKREEKEQKRALRREQKRQRRQRKRALMGLDPYGNDGDSGGESSSSSSSSSMSTSSASASSSSSNIKNGESYGRDSGHGGQIRAADSRAMLLLSDASTAPEDIELFGGGGNAPLTAAHPEALDDDLVEGRILTSAGTAAALGLGLLFTPREDTTELLPRRADGDADRDPSGCVPSYLLNTPLEARTSDGMTFQPRPGSDYAPSLAPTIASDGSSTLSRTVETSEQTSPSVPLPNGRSTDDSRGSGSRGASVRLAEMNDDDHEQFLAMRDERSRKIAEQLAALQEESRQLQQQSMLLQERTREISRSVGLTTPLQFTNASTSTLLLKQPHTHLQVAEQAGPAAGPSPGEPEGPPSGASGIMAIGSLSHLQYRVPSPAVTAATESLGLADGLAPSPLESQPCSDANPLDASPLQKQAPINWALPGRNAKPMISKRPAATKAAAPPQAQAFPMPPNGAHRMQALAHAKMQRTGSSSSLIDSLLPRWAEQVESPVMTPENRHSNLHPHALPPLPGRPPAAAIDGASEGMSPASPPQPLMQHIPKGRQGRIPSPPVAGAVAGGRGQGLLHVKSRLGAAIATSAPGPHQRGHAGPLTKAGIPSKMTQPQSGQPQESLGMPPLAAPVGILQSPYEPMLAAAQQLVMPADWGQAGVPLGLPQPPLALPPLPSLPLAPGTVFGLGAMFPPPPGMIQPPASIATTNGPSTAPAPAPVTKRAMGSKGPMRSMKPVKATAGLAGAGNGFAGGGVSNNGEVMDDSYNRGSTGGMEKPPPWVQIPGQSLAMGASPGTVPMPMQLPLGSLGLLPSPGFNPGAPNGMTVPWIYDRINGSDGVGDGNDTSAFQHQNRPALPPVRLQAGKGKMSRSAPPGSYSAREKAVTNVTAEAPSSMGLGFGLPMVAWPAPAITTHHPYMHYILSARDASSGMEAMVQRANVVQQQQTDRYRELESNLANKLDQASPGGKVRDQRRNSHDGRPVFRLF
ncbi:hypothetical protein Vafri_13455 [Volvox africanus]|nr:hypothetical protein Vafri_13455 [Volvox africanus]